MGEILNPQECFAWKRKWFLRRELQLSVDLLLFGKQGLEPLGRSELGHQAVRQILRRCACLNV